MKNSGTPRSDLTQKQKKDPELLLASPGLSFLRTGGYVANHVAVPYDMNSSYSIVVLILIYLLQFYLFE